MGFWGFTFKDKSMFLQMRMMCSLLFLKSKIILRFVPRLILLRCYNKKMKDSRCNYKKSLCRAKQILILRIWLWVIWNGIWNQMLIKK